ncbi:redoxin domain-containing protein [Pseudoalteromonas luteoviolacea]|uniref:redoxin domain-containing protein n=1 Tax=Pseudoalteromonas luteoviolacea TaxID=43657 RepID=UPI00114F0736|nr:redoxin domain-containing protein [Pseudoalteromonas luteoviolacea]TQF73054.1 redoxin domain-containing protein [Pseudoalteromonas luteoviolacea]
MSKIYTNKLHPGVTFPKVALSLMNGEQRILGKPQNGLDWQLVSFYRGQHCPLCTKYLNLLQTYKNKLVEIGVDIIAVSGDSKTQLESHLEKVQVDYPIAYGLTVEQMKTFGLYISDPRSEQETDHPFAEPGLFVVNSDGDIQVVDISNNPFVRPELEPLINGLRWIRNPDNNYPIRGMHSF